MAVGARAEQRREELGWSQARVAEGVSRLTGEPLHQTAIDKMEKRDSRRPRYLPELAIVLGVTEKWLLSGKEPKLRPPQDGEAVRPPALVPIVSWVSAGKLSVADPQDVLGEIAVSGLDQKGAWIALVVEGDSMDRISPPDSIIIVNTKDTKLVPNGCYVIANEDGEATYKRFRSNPPRFEPVSTSPKHETFFFDGDPPKIVGRVRRSVLEM